jgi:hypothetical protein
MTDQPDNKKRAAFKLGMCFAAHERGVPEDARQVFFKLCHHVMNGNLKTPQDVINCLDKSREKVAEVDSEMLSHGLGGAGAGVATAYVINKLRELMAAREHPAESEQRRNKALLLGALAGGGLGLGKYYSDKGDTLPVDIPTTINL